MTRFSKLLGGILGSVTASGLVGVADLVGLDLDPALAGGIVVVLTWLGTYLAPKNADPTAMPALDPAIPDEVTPPH